MNDVMLEKSDKAIMDFLDADARKCEAKEFGRLYQKANIALRVKHSYMVNDRIAIDQKLKMIGMAFTNPEIRERYIRATLPKMLPDAKK